MLSPQRKGCNDMRTTWYVALFAASAMVGTIDVIHAQPEENSGRNEFLRSCASCHGVTGKGRWTRCEVAQLSPIRFDQAFRSKQRRFSRLTRPRGYRRQDRKIGPWHAGWGDRYMREMTSPESGGWVSKEWDEAIVRRRILALVEYISTLQRATRRSR